MLLCWMRPIDKPSMAELMSIFERGDKNRWDNHLKRVADEEARQQLLNVFAKPQRLKRIEPEDD
ncbi:MAG: hypothetical protein ACR2NZ_03310 [Rubripirellula sp.]